MKLFDAMKKAVSELEGAYAIAAISSREPHTVVGSRRGSPLLLGVGNAGSGLGENFLASDTSALLQVTKYVAYLEEGDVVEIRLDGYSICDRDGNPVQRPIIESQLSADSIELGNHAHYMQKEIFEQPGAIANTLEMVATASSVSPGLFGADAQEVFARTQQVLILACGTSYHAGLVAKYWLEAVAKLPTSVEIASEYRYRQTVPLPGTLVLTISQSGETADTLAALQHAKALGLGDSLTICNAPESALIRQSKLRFLTRAGPEIGVASTKAFTTQLASLFVLTMVLAKLRGWLSAERERELLAQLRHLPAAMSRVLECEPVLRHWAHRFALKDHALFLGRGVHFPIAMEGALKLKEISYIHAEAYAAGELKHGPLALVDSQMPVVVIAPNDTLIEKLKSNLQEVRARRRALRVRRSRHADRTVGRREHRQPRRSRRPALADPARRAAAAARLPHRARARHRRRQAEEPRQERHGRVGRSSISRAWRECSAGNAIDTETPGPAPLTSTNGALLPDARILKVAQILIWTLAIAAGLREFWLQVVRVGSCRLLPAPLDPFRHLCSAATPGQPFPRTLVCTAPGTALLGRHAVAQAAKGDGADRVADLAGRLFVDRIGDRAPAGHGLVSRVDLPDSGHPGRLVESRSHAAEHNDAWSLNRCGKC
jgi:glucosamine--fructose-6-phosphate aminotransferase (isomerizing)